MGQKKKIKTKNGYTLVGLAIIIIVAILILLLVVVFFGAGIAAWWNSRGEASPNINCDTWAGAPAGYQDKITAAANKAGIQPALLGAIFLSEHSNNWTTTPDGNNQGPFQIPNKSDYAQFLKDEGFDVSTVGRSDWWNDFDTAAYAAAVDIKNGFKWANKPTNSSDEQAIVFAGLWYNTGPVAAKEWANAGYNLNVPPPSKPEWGNPGTQQYAKRTWTNFQKLNLGCKAFTPSAGASYIQACQGGTTGSGGNVIVIDPGHGTKINTRPSFEDSDNLTTAKVLRDELASRLPGVKVVMTRTTTGDAINASVPSGFPSNLSNKEEVENYKRAQIANENNADVVVHIHSDAGSSKGYMLLYPGGQGKTKSGTDGPAGDGTVTSKSTALAQTMNDKMKKSLSLKKISSTNDFYADKGYGILSYDAPLRSAAAVTVEMFGNEDTSYANRFDDNTGGLMDKMVNGIADGVVSYLATLPKTGSGQAQTATTMTKACQLANLALETAKDIKAHECPKGDGCANNSGKYYSSSNGWSQYASNYVQDGGPITWGGRGVSGFTSCARFVGTLVKKMYDRGYPLETSSDQWDYVIRHRDKYDIKSFVSTEAQPGDIVFRGSCNIANSIPGAQTLESLEACFGRKNGVGHTEIYTGTNDAFPNSIAIGASLGGWGPSPRSGISGDMGLRARLKN